MSGQESHTQFRNPPLPIYIFRGRFDTHTRASNQGPLLNLESVLSRVVSSISFSPPIVHF